MGLIGREIIQSVAYDDPNAKRPNLNYRETFPITVFDAVRESMDDPDGRTLQDVLNLIFQMLQDKQPIFKAHPANFLMTYAGVAGGAGAIQIAQDIPWNPEQQSQDRIPTEKAVGNLMFKLGLVDENGNPVNDPESKHVRWSDIIGRPLAYTGVGPHDDGFMTQKAVSELFKQMEIKMDDIGDLSAAKVDAFIERLNNHTSNTSNPHAVTADQVGAVSKEALRYHIEEAENPHRITPAMIGLDQIDNTSDEDKPLSAAMRQAIVHINETILDITNNIGDLDFVIAADYDQHSGNFTINFKSGNEVILHIPINGLVDEITYDKGTKELIFYELGGDSKRVSVADLFIRYIGSVGSEIQVTIDSDQETGPQTIRAEIRNGSITAEKLAEGALNTSVISDQAITAEKIKDLTITSIKIADGAIITEKIGEKAVTSTRIADRAVTGRQLFTSGLPNRILAVQDAGTDPLWSLIYGSMIDDGAIQTRHILNFSVTPEKLAERSVTTSKLENQAVTNDKLAPNAVRSENIIPNSIPGSKLAIGILMPGTPLIEKRPGEKADNNQIPDTHWVREFLKGSVLTHENMGKRIVDGTNLFSSDVRNRVLTVGRAKSDPVWSQVNGEMIADGAVDTRNIAGLAITAPKLADEVIESRHIGRGVIKGIHIANEAVSSENLFKAPGAGYLLGTISDDGIPIYAKLMENMVAPNTIGTMAIQDNSVTPSKVQTSPDGAVVLGVHLKNTSPVWTKISSSMIAPRAVNGAALFSSSVANQVLVTDKPGTDPHWGTINAGMIDERAVRSEHIAPNVIKTEHLQEKIIEGRHLAEWSIPGNRILPRSITGAHLVTSENANRVLGITDPYSDAQWLQVQTDMIADKAITKEKMMQSENPYRVLGATQAGVPPEYLMITHQFIVDGTIIPSKLERNFVLQGTPELTAHPAADADNFQLASTKWVRKVIRDMWIDTIPTILSNFLELTAAQIEEEWATKGTKPDGPDNDDIFISKDDIIASGNFETIPGGSGSSGGMGIFPVQNVTHDMIDDHAIDGRKLFTHPYGPRVLGITAPNEDVEFILIEEDLISDGAVTTNKIQRDLHLLGSPKLEVRPQPSASTQYGGGDLIPDCQWVLDRIAEAAKYGVNGFSGNNMKEITPEQVKYEWQTKGTTPDEEPTDDFESVDGNAPSTIPGGGSGGGSSGSGDGVYKVSDKVVDNIHNAAYNSTIPDIEPSEDPKDVKPTYDGDYKKILSGGSAVGNGTPIGILMNDVVTTPTIQNRAVTGQKLFTSIVGHRVLGVRTANSDPEYLQIDNEMVQERAIDGRTLFSTDEGYKSLIVKEPGTNPIWGLITASMLEDRAVTTSKIKDRAVTHDKLAQAAVDAENLVERAIISNTHLKDGIVTDQKLADHAVTPVKIARRAVKAEHIEKDIVLPGHPTVAPDTGYETRSLRNIILSPNPPTNSGNSGFSNGDIWFQYI